MDKHCQHKDEVETPGGLLEMQRRIEKQRKKDNGETEVKPKDVFAGWKEQKGRRRKKLR